MKPLLEESGKYLQTISSNHLLPYENLQTLTSDYDRMQEDLIEKLKSIEEMLQELTVDNDKWTKFNEQLKRSETFLREIGALFDPKSFADKPLEEKQQLLEVEIKNFVSYTFYRNACFVAYSF